MSKSSQVAVVMGSKSDWQTMQETTKLLKQLGVSYQCQVISAHRTPDLLMYFAQHAKEEGFSVVIAGAGGAAHLPGMLAAKTTLPVIGVPIQSKALNGMDSLLSIAQMPAGIPVATMSIGESGAKNAALYAAAILATHDSEVHQTLVNYRYNQTQAVLNDLHFDE